MAKGSARRRGSGSGGRHPAPPTLEIRRRRFRDADLRSCTLAIAATDDPAVNRAVFAGALRRRIPCNVVDRPQLCTFIAPSILRRGDLAIAISTGGASPALARRLRQKLQRRIGSEYAAFLRLLGRARLKLKRRRASLSVRKRLLYRLVDSRALELIRRGRMNEARSLADSILGELGL
jgi:precorrin-2 dehydrogenase/sirohydrochlorin ferrochelatase